MITMNTMCNILGLLMGLYVTVLMIVAPNSQPFSVRKSSALLVAGESWTAKDLAKLARTDKAPDERRPQLGRGCARS